MSRCNYALLSHFLQQSCIFLTSMKYPLSCCILHSIPILQSHTIVCRCRQPIEILRMSEDLVPNPNMYEVMVPILLMCEILALILLINEELVPFLHICLELVQILHIINHHREKFQRKIVDPKIHRNRLYVNSHLENVPFGKCDELVPILLKDVKCMNLEIYGSTKPYNANSARFQPYEQ